MCADGKSHPDAGPESYVDRGKRVLVVMKPAVAVV